MEAVFVRFRIANRCFVLCGDSRLFLFARGKVIIVAFLIILLKTIGSFIEAIVDCNKYYVDKRKKEIDKQIAYEKFLNQQASNHVAKGDQSQVH